MTSTARHASRPSRLAIAITVLVVFNALTIAVIAAGGLPAHPGVFTAWFVGDMIVGLWALGLTERA